MTATADLRGIAVLNPVTGRYSSESRATFTPLFADNFASGVVGQSYPSFNSKSVYADDQPELEGQSLKIVLDAFNPVSGCGGDHYYGGRRALPQTIPIGNWIWFMVRRYIPSTFTWGYCYGAGDGADALACGKEFDGGEWLKDMVLAPLNGTGRIYVQPGVQRRNVEQTPNKMRVLAENDGNATLANSFTQQFPLDEWFTTQVAVKVSSDGTGIMRVWINETLVCEAEGQNVTADNALSQWGIGDYWNGVPYTNGDNDQEQYWVKDVIIATDKEGFGAPNALDADGNVYINPNTTADQFI